MRVLVGYVADHQRCAPVCTREHVVNRDGSASLLRARLKVLATTTAPSTAIFAHVRALRGACALVGVTLLAVHAHMGACRGRIGALMPTPVATTGIVPSPAHSRRWQRRQLRKGHVRAQTCLLLAVPIVSIQQSLILALEFVPSTTHERTALCVPVTCLLRPRRCAGVKMRLSM